MRRLGVVLVVDLTLHDKRIDENEPSVNSDEIFPTCWRRSAARNRALPSRCTSGDGHRINNRRHGTILILVVDGRIGYTGGVGIGDEWTEAAMAQLQAAFMKNWILPGVAAGR